MSLVPGPDLEGSRTVASSTPVRISVPLTRTGLTIDAELDTHSYPKGIKIPDHDMKTLETTGILTRHDFHGEWNYSLIPGAP